MRNPGHAHVLVVDDEPSIREMLALYLREEGYGVVIASDGLEAMQSIRDRRPAAIVLDLMMPRLDGFGLMHELESAGYSDIPLIVCSASRLIERKLERSTIVGFLAKPFNFDDLDRLMQRTVLPAP